jgi:hypothetical protein
MSPIRDSRRGPARTYTGKERSDVYPNTATLSFRTVRYQSTELTLRTTELADNAGRPLQPQTALDARLIDAFEVLHDEAALQPATGSDALQSGPHVGCAH